MNFRATIFCLLSIGLTSAILGMDDFSLTPDNALPEKAEFAKPQMMTIGKKSSKRLHTPSPTPPAPQKKLKVTEIDGNSQQPARKAHKEQPAHQENITPDKNSPTQMSDAEILDAAIKLALSTPAQKTPIIKRCKSVAPSWKKIAHMQNFNGSNKQGIPLGELEVAEEEQEFSDSELSEQSDGDDPDMVVIANRDMDTLKKINRMSYQEHAAWYAQQKAAQKSALGFMQSKS